MLTSPLHPALQWAEPFIAYEFAKAGKSTRRIETHGERRAADTSSCIDFELCDPETNRPSFSPTRLQQVLSMERTLNFLAKAGPGGHFRMHGNPHQLRLEWNAQEPAKSPSATSNAPEHKP